MQRISSSSTLLLAIFFPILWTVFFGSFFVAIILNREEISGAVTQPIFLIIYAIIYILFLVFMIFTIRRLRRVELDKQFIYVTNFFKNARYPYHQVDYVDEKNLILFSLGKIRLKIKGIFGRNIYYIRSQAKHKLAEEKYDVFRDLIVPPSNPK